MTQSICWSRIVVVAAAAAAATFLALAVPAVALSAQPDPAAGVETLSLAEIESRLQAQGIRVEELEVEGLLVEVEGRDAEGREIELKIDRRNGEVLARKYED
jgi:hypothetical protein